MANIYTPGGPLVVPPDPIVVPPEIPEAGADATDDALSDKIERLEAESMLFLSHSTIPRRHLWVYS